MIYARINAEGDDHVWIHLVPEENALQRARELGAWSADQPLFGIPFAVKDNIDVEGLPTTAGCPAFSYVPQRTASAVQKVMDAGGILIGKTNMDQFATGLVGTRSPYGACSSIFHPDYISGGSSSGSAVAVAKGEVCFALGTDTAGSGRVPAAFNGIVGIKPTRGLVSTAGVVPACRSLDCVSIFSPDVETGAKVLEILAGVDESDPYSRSGQHQRDRSTPPKIGVPSPHQMQFFGDEAAADCWRRAVLQARAVFTQSEWTEIDLTPFQRAAELLYSGPFVAERYASVGPFVASRPASDLDPSVREIILGATEYSAVDLFQAEYRLQELRSTVNKIFEGAQGKVDGKINDKLDALLLPTAPTIYRIEEIRRNPIELNSRLGVYTNFVNLLDLCAVAVPAGLRDDGLPFGVTLMAPAFCDLRLLTLAHAWEGSVASPERAGRDPQAPKVTAPLEAATQAPFCGLLPGSDSMQLASCVQLAVVGAHLKGQPLNHQLTSRGARLLRITRTAPKYRLFALANTTPPKPGLLRAGEPQPNGAEAPNGIEVEVWQLTNDAFGSLVAEIPPPMGIGNLELADGSLVKGFICEPYALEGAEEITGLGGWRNYLKGRHQG
jgi:allophanate hydrolase